MTRTTQHFSRTSTDTPAIHALASTRVEDLVFSPDAPDTSALPEALAADVQAAFAFSHANIAPSTRLAYQKAWQRFLAWARAQGLPTLPTTGTALATYASHLARTGKKYATIQVASSAVTSAHDAAGIDPNPCRSSVVKTTLAGIARTIGRAQKQKREIVASEVRRMVARTEDSLVGARDRLLLLLWFVCASRRSEIIDLNIDDLAFRDDGLYVTFRKSKTDQEQLGMIKPVPYSSGSAWCPVRAAKAWIDVLATNGLLTGPLFRPIVGAGWIQPRGLSAAAAVDRVKHYARLVGIDPALVSGHSLRAGFATTAARSGRAEHRIMEQTGHKRFDTMLRYVRRANAMKNSAAVGLLDEGAQ